MTDFWWKDAIIYAVDVERFHDGNGDGIGDFPGLTSKLDYIADLNVSCIWLLPFCPSTDLDNGYDVTDYFRVDPKYGTFDDFLTFLHAAGERGIRVILDLVLHHTSIEHPWFHAARQDQTSRFRDYYVWSPQPPPVPPGKGPMFPGQESTVWTYDEVARSYYHHRFYRFQPDLNHTNPELFNEVARILDFWLSFGISGYRIDAASHMVEQPLAKEPGDGSHDILRRLYRHVSKTRPDAVLLGEVDEEPARVGEFFDGKQLNMLFNFILDNYLLLGLAEERADAVRRGVEMLPSCPPNGQWANFLRNLDEADLERLTEEERKCVLDIFAPREDMRIYQRGIRRRLAPMLKGDQRRIRMAQSLLFSMPGVPVFVYGDEIGMGEDLTQEGRNSVRSPMQWSSARNGGFSTAPAGKLVQPAIRDGRFGFRRVNVEAQQGENGSLLSFMKQLAAVRRKQDIIGHTACEFIETGNERVLAHCYRSDGSMLMMLHNLGGRAATVDVELPAGEPMKAILGEMPAISADGRRLRARLEPYGFRWLGTGEALT